MAMRRYQGQPQLLSATGQGVGVVEFCSKLLPGRSVLVWYADDNVWHERVLLFPKGPREWVSLTPDKDRYAERLDCMGGTCVRARVMDDKAKTPGDLTGQCYRFSKRLTTLELKEEILAAEAEVKEEIGGEVVRPLQVLGLRGKPYKYEEFCGIEDSSDAGEEAGDPARAANETPAGEGTVVGEEEDTVYVSLVAEGAVKLHEQFQPGPEDLRAGGYVLHRLPDGAIVPLRQMSAVEAAALPAGGAKVAPVAAPAPGDVSDARILSPLTYDHRGKRWLEFGEAVNRTREEPLDDFPVRGERGFGWLISYIKDHGGTPDGRQTKWGIEQSVAKDSAVWIIHDMVGFSIELALCYDQLDAVNLASFEVLGRLYQLLEETMGSMKVEGIDHYIGRSESSGLRRGIALAPSLAKHTTEALAKETEIIKQRRKAREEEQALRAGGPGRKGK